MFEDFSCEIKVRPLSEWIQDNNGKQCPVCILRPTVEYYMGSLKEAHETKQIKKLEEAWSARDPLTIAQTMDKIKSEVGENLKRDLIAIDCFAQSFEAS